MSVFLVSFSGIDGSGKTTLSKILVKELKERGVECKYVYGRLEPIISRPLILAGRKIFLRKRDVKKDYKGYLSEKKEVFKKYSLFSKIYYYILVLDYTLQLFFKIRLPLLFGKKLICDRYVYDTLVMDLVIDFNLNEYQMLRLLNRFFWVVPRPNVAFLIDLDEEIAFHRKSDTPSVDYLRERREVYLRIAEKERMVILDGTEDLQKIKGRVLEIIMELVKGRRFK